MYATCLWNHIDSSNGSQRIFGRTSLSRVRHIGRTINVVSTLSTRPAPREIHTENLNRLSGANRASEACFHLLDCEKGR